MKNLVRGLQEFKQNYVAGHQQLFEELSHGQKPRVLFITCSDSRINPNLITQTDVGELFVIRNAGNIIPPYGAANGGEGGTIEYAIGALGIEQVVVCGHSHCGAMKGLMKLNQLQADMPLVYNWLQHAETTRRIVVDNYPHAEGEEQVEILVAENVLVQIDNLQTYPIIRSRLMQGKLHIYAWVYYIETGEVLAYDKQTHTYVPPQSQILEAEPTSSPEGKQPLISTHAPPIACEIPALRLQSASANHKPSSVAAEVNAVDRIRTQLNTLLANSPDSWTDVDTSIRFMSQLLEDARAVGMSANEAQKYHYRFSEQIPLWLKHMG
ncbi:MAG: carbonic anhydrase [Acaryochloris sp. RU_4_1]|nr:carbonic anhydrase [Acaryochloris sp. RU_4_1]NJR55189.1 carbonic anhydrase [Acaryochloris sp. CRU_2_0]